MSLVWSRSSFSGIVLHLHSGVSLIVEPYFVWTVLHFYFPGLVTYCFFVLSQSTENPLFLFVKKITRLMNDGVSLLLMFVHLALNTFRPLSFFCLFLQFWLLWSHNGALLSVNAKGRKQAFSIDLLTIQFSRVKKICNICIIRYDCITYSCVIIILEELKLKKIVSSIHFLSCFVFVNLLQTMSFSHTFLKS